MESLLPYQTMEMSVSKEVRNFLVMLKTVRHHSFMDFPEDQIDELKRIAPSISLAVEGGYTFIYIEQLKLPDGCKPEAVDVLLCPMPKDGYMSRLFFSEQITGCPTRNWNGNLRALNRNWHAISWRVNDGYRLLEMLLIHLKALRN